MTAKNTIGLIVITKNEEAYLARCLDSCKFVDEIFVVDSFSSDETINIAQKYTENVFQKTWTNWYEQRMFGIQKMTSDWVLIMDADEFLSLEAQKEVRRISCQEEFSSLSLPRRNFLLGGWVSHSGWYPDYQSRLILRKTMCGNGELVHTSFLSSGKAYQVPKDSEAYIHHNTCDSIHKYLEKINLSTSMDAKNLLNSPHFKLTKLGIFTRAMGMFTQSYWHNKGYKDGMRGLIVAGFEFIYSFVLMIKMWELTSPPNGAVQTIIDETNGPNPNSEDIDTRVFNIVPDFTGSLPSLTHNLLS